MRKSSAFGYKIITGYYRKVELKALKRSTNSKPLL